MKYYETQYEDYLRSSARYDIHPELAEPLARMPQCVQECPSVIFYGPPGAGKYTQALRLIERYSPSRLKYFKKMTAQQKDPLSGGGQSVSAAAAAAEKEWTFRISDVHYEIDFSLLGCESKKTWNDCFFQIVDVISVKPEKAGIIVCKNFHAIHGELLEVFYSYMQHCGLLHIRIAFFILTEHVSFLPSNIVQCCQVLPVCRPSREAYMKLAEWGTSTSHVATKNARFQNRLQRIGVPDAKMMQQARVNMRAIPPDAILNLKETQYLGLVESVDQLPRDVFNIVCDNVIREMEKAGASSEKMNYAEFRDNLYDILLYGLDITECLWYILFHFVNTTTSYATTRDKDQLKSGAGCLLESELPDILSRMHVFLKYYNNNYRPIYHLESMAFYLISRIYKFPALDSDA